GLHFGDRQRGAPAVCPVAGSDPGRQVGRSPRPAGPAAAAASGIVCRAQPGLPQVRPVVAGHGQRALPYSGGAAAAGHQGAHSPGHGRAGTDIKNGRASGHFYGSGVNGSGVSVIVAAVVVTLMLIFPVAVVIMMAVVAGTTGLVDDHAG